MTAATGLELMVASTCSCGCGRVQIVQLGAAKPCSEFETALSVCLQEYLVRVRTQARLLASKQPPHQPSTPCLKARLTLTRDTWPAPALCVWLQMTEWFNNILNREQEVNYNAQGQPMTSTPEDFFNLIHLQVSQEQTRTSRPPS